MFLFNKNFKPYSWSSITQKRFIYLYAILDIGDFLITIINWVDILLLNLSF